MFTSVAMGKGAGIVPTYMAPLFRKGVVTIGRSFCPRDDKYCMIYKNGELAINGLVKRFAKIVGQSMPCFGAQGADK